MMMLNLSLVTIFGTMLVFHGHSFSTFAIDYYYYYFYVCRFIWIFVLNITSHNNNFTYYSSIFHLLASSIRLKQCDREYHKTTILFTNIKFNSPNCETQHHHVLNVKIVTKIDDDRNRTENVPIIWYWNDADLNAKRKNDWNKSNRINIELVWNRKNDNLDSKRYVDFDLKIAKINQCWWAIDSIYIWMCMWYVCAHIVHSLLQMKYNMI